MAGIAPNYTILAEQMRLFEESGVVSSLRISNIALDQGGNIGFNIVLNFDSSYVQAKKMNREWTRINANKIGKK